MILLCASDRVILSTYGGWELVELFFFLQCSSDHINNRIFLLYLLLVIFIGHTHRDKG